MTRPDDDAERSLRLYRVLLRLFPRRFRLDRARPMEQLFMDMVRERSRAGRAPGIGFWAAVVWDTVSHAVRERLRSFGQSRQAGDMDRTSTLMNGTLSDLRYALRSMARQPLYAILTVVMMTLAIAGNTAVFRIFNGLFLRPLPFAESERLMDLDETAPQWNLEYTSVAYPDLVAWRRDNQSFTGIGAYSESSMDLASDGQAVHVGVLRATHDLTTVLRLEPVVGRAFIADDDVPNGPRVALLTHAFWQSQFGGRPDVVGTTIRLATETYEVIGVLPAAADFLEDAGVWLPLQENASENTGGWYLKGIGRLAEGVTLDRAREDLLRVHRGMIREWDLNNITSPVVNPLRDRYLGEVRLGSTVLLASVAIVLLIACANIAGLMLARTLVRGREMGIRVALGATARRIVRQLLTESLVLAAAGAVLGAVIGSWVSTLLVARMSEQFPRWVTFDLDWRFLAFSAAATVGAALVFGLAPALQSAGVDLSTLLHGTSTRASASGSRRRSMSALVVGEVALALVLLVAAGLAVRDFPQLLRVDPGFRTANMLSYTITTQARYGGNSERILFWSEHLERVRALPGVTSAATANRLPLAGHWGFFFQVEGAPPRAPDEPNPVVLNRVVSPGYLETMDVPLIAGRDFNDTDGRTEGARAVIVDESFARQFFAPNEEVLGRRIHTGSGDSPWMTIIGIARDVRHYGVD